jgi:hypothetical protein
MTTTYGALVLKAFLLDTQIEHPDGIVIDDGDKPVLYSEILRNDPSILPRLKRERAEVYRQLGWAQP